MEGEAKAASAGDVSPEAAIGACVKRFYEKGEADNLLGPIFENFIPELEAHLEVVANFWSHALLGTTRYEGTPFGVHINLPIEPEHFARWVALFSESANHAGGSGLGCNCAR